MAIPPVIGIGDLVPKFLTDALILLRPFRTAGTIPACPFQAFPDGLYHFLVFIQPNSHIITPFFPIIKPIIVRVKWKKPEFRFL